MCKTAGIVISILILALMAWSGLEKAASHIIGIYTNVPESKAVNFKNYIQQIDFMRDRLDTMTWEDFKKQEKIKLDYERNIAVLGDKILQRLIKENQIDR